MPSYFELCIKVNTVTHAHKCMCNHTHTLSMDSQPLYMESSNHREVRMICKCFIFAGRKFEREAQKVNN